MRHIFTYLLISILSAGLYAQTGTIAGTVYDQQKLALPAAIVQIESLGIGVIADEYGNFSLGNVPKGSYEVKASYLGYEPMVQSVSLTAENPNTSINFSFTAPITVGDEIIIFGDRLKGQAKALNQQKNNLNITNIVSSDQIGRFPDANIGDAMKRIPGITVAYDQGEARFGLIRGIEPHYNSVMINGERVPSAEGDKRAVQLDLIPSDMIQTIEVNKAVTPDMDADALGGAVNLVTRAAPNGLRVSATAASGYNFLAQKPMAIGGLVIGNRFLDNKLGVIVSASYHNHQLGSDNSEGEWAEDDNGNFYVAEWDIRRYDIQRVRRSGSVSLDFTPAEGHIITLRSMYNWRDDWENRYRTRYKLDEPNEQGIVEETEIRRQTKGGIGNDRVDNRRLEDQRTNSTQLAGKHQFGQLNLNWSATYSQASEKRPNERYIEWRVKDIPVQTDISNPEAPMFDAVNADDVALGNYGLREITEENQFTQEQDFNARVDLELPLLSEGDYKNKLKFGARLRTKSKERENDFFEYAPINEDDFASLAGVPNEDVSKDNYLAGDYQSGTFATSGFLGSLNLEDASAFEKVDLPEEYAGGNFTANETVSGGYLMLTQNLGQRLLAIAGLRIEHTQVNYSGNQVTIDDNGIVVTPTSGTSSYTNILPGLHLKYTASDHTIFRAAWTNTLARPNYIDLVPYRELNNEDNELSEGNPDLKPVTSMNFDLMAEHYFTSVGLLSGGVFYKDIENFFYTPAVDDYLDPVSGNTFDEYVQPQNGSDATLFGFEFAFQRQLDFLPGALKGLGVYANYTFTSSTANIPDRTEAITLPGSARHLMNGSLSYENKKLVLRLSVNYSSPFLDADGLDLTENLERYYDEVLYLDFNGSYAVNPNIRFFVEGNNLTNQPLRFYAGDPSRTYQAEFYNSRFSAGLKFDF